MTAVLAMSLMACNKEEDPQKLFIEGSKLLEEADTYESHSTVDLNIEVNASENSETLTTEEQQILKAINSAKMNVTSIVDAKNEMYEIGLDASLEFGFIKPEIKATLLMDYKNNTIYVDGSALYDEFHIFVQEMLPTFDASIIKDHIIVMDLEALSSEMGDELNLDDMKVAPELTSSEILSSIAKENFTLLELSKEEKAKKAKNKVQLSLTDAEIKGIVIDVMEKVDPETSKVLQEDIDMFTFDSFTVTALYNKEGSLIQDEIAMSITVSEQEMLMNSVTIDFSIITEYKNVNKPVTFKIDPETDKKIDLMDLVQQLIMSEMGF
jgi:hypothetical protein